jgi:hypothetical protein
LKKLARIKRFILFHGKRHRADLVPADTEPLLIQLMLIRASAPEQAVLLKLIIIDSESSIAQRICARMSERSRYPSGQ